MFTSRLIPCLDIQNGRVVKGKSFASLTDSGDPVELAAQYYSQGADEIVLLDISATVEERQTMRDVISRITKRIPIPVTVGGGVRSISDITRLLRTGADKVSLNSAALADPTLIRDAAREFGSQCIVVAIDVKREGKGWTVFSHSASQSAKLDALAWITQVQDLGAGELLVTSIDEDGQQGGYDLDLLRAISNMIRIPLIASGGVGNLEHLHEGLASGADAVLAASIFHYGTYTIREAKDYLIMRGCSMRPPEALIPTIIQDADTKQVLMLGYSTLESRRITSHTGMVHFYSRSTRRIWKKGGSSGNVLHLIRSSLDCDRDTLLYEVHLTGTHVCHTGTMSCFSPLEGCPEGGVDLSRQK